MFTGIISDIGKILEIKNNGSLEFTVACNYEINEVLIGSSIAHDGVCLTVIDKGKNHNQNWYKVNVSDETINCTKLVKSGKYWKVGSRINLERSLKVGDELGGHIVSGHVDGIAKITQIENIGDNTKICLLGPVELSKYIAKKGSIALDGTSLTVNVAEGAKFEINLIPHTKKSTTWNSLKPEDFVNVEIDPLARYISRINELRE